MELGNIFGNYLQRVCLHEYTMAALLTTLILYLKNRFSCMISTFFIVISVFLRCVKILIYLLNFYYERILCFDIKH